MPGDGIGYMNRGLIMKSVRQDGLILKPDMPAVYPDVLYVKKAWGEAKASDYIATTFSRHDQWLWVMTLGLTFNNSWLGLTVRDVLPSFARQSSTRFLVSHRVGGEAHTGEMGEVGLDDALPRLHLTEPEPSAWVLQTLMPVMRLEGVGVSVVIVGEVGKWVVMSRQRVRDVRVGGEGVSAVLMGSEGEVVHMDYQWRNDTKGGPWSLVLSQCTIGPSTTVVWSISAINPSTHSCTTGGVYSA
jgi:hypothetical protein